jgi:hypothetical protein
MEILIITRNFRKNIIPKIGLDPTKKESLCVKKQGTCCRISQNYYLLHKQEINLKHRQWYRKNKINESSKMSRTRM